MITIQQLDVLRRLRDNWLVLSPEEQAALTDVINHFDACIDCIRIAESQHARHE